MPHDTYIGNCRCTRVKFCQRNRNTTCLFRRGLSFKIIYGLMYLKSVLFILSFYEEILFILFFFMREFPSYLYLNKKI